jgi:hypothetical protein
MLKVVRSLFRAPYKGRKQFILIKHISMLLCQIYFLLWEDMDRWDLSNVDILSTKEIKKRRRSESIIEK